MKNKGAFNNEHSIKAIGVMSGTSLDGIDIAACEFWQNNNQIKFKIHFSETIEYSDNLYQRLLNAPKLSGFDLAMLNVDYGKVIGNSINAFITNTDFAPYFIASHGYTVFHEPQNGLTMQIGSGAEIAAITGIKTICDFRTTDVALGGQGAPLVPIGDELLFGKYAACLNLGGFANISCDNNSRREAFDICPANFLLNYFAQKLGHTFDSSGNLGKQGEINKALLNSLNSLEFYTQNGPKSLGREFVEKNIFPLLDNEISIYDLLRTCYEHIAIQLSTELNKFPIKDVLITGGGAHNTFLMELLEDRTTAKIVIPEKDIVDYKEALIFAFLGYLRIDEKPNCLRSVTGAKRDNIGGAVYL